MQLKRNWFNNFCISLAIIGLLYVMICGFTFLGGDKEYPDLLKGVLIFTLLGVWIGIKLLGNLAERLHLSMIFSENKNWVRIIQIVIVVVILVIAAAIRIIIIQKIPMKPESDYKTYYEIAKLLKSGDILEKGKGYCNYIALFPHVMGYSYILKKAFEWFGTSVIVGQYVNVFFSVGTVYLMYRIARLIKGRIAGMVALVLCAFWPSQILYITMLSAEYAFTFFFYLCILLFLTSMKDEDMNQKQPLKVVLSHVLLGVLIALTAAIRPMALILLIAIILCIFPQKMKLANLPRNDLPLLLRLIEKGWRRCILILIPYIIISNVITSNIELTVDKTLPSSAESFGYNLLVGLNIKSVGGWNEQDANLLENTMEKTNSASKAHIACRNIALKRLTSNPKGIFNLFIAKYELLWGNDDYGSTWNLTFLNEQKHLTKAKSDFLYEIRDYNNILYIMTVFFALVALLYLLKKEKEESYAILLILIYIGTVGMHLFVESQNRYHYFVLQIFIVLAGMGVEWIIEDAKQTVGNVLCERELALTLEDEGQNEIEELEAEKLRIQELVKKEMSHSFDMTEALKNGHVVMTVSEVYGKDNNEVFDEKDKEEEVI
ncbi:hypothetical protein [Anaeromicropila herbilytica]|uniref:Glycosyltransferase RgtA/B/C/D-like domain-containing protein n=1 Tax=Anaeromicropila herbilytica TaxID=2785025 RepID=A0A7R7IBS4_9FIRM|nr:hypothetical protein [Anaeromicropila herbilytica]BCN29943.1 hypothetical protein bsdtb5_12380 [Anaeromicropila herbilytica]